MLTNIIISYVLHCGMYANVYQYDEDNQLKTTIQIPGSIYFVEFFHWTKDKQYVCDGKLTVASSTKKSYHFQMDIKGLKKATGHLSIKNAKPNEPFFLVERTLHINSEKVGFKSDYAKIDFRVPGTKTAIHNNNFTLFQNIRWNHGESSIPLLYDLHDYHDLEMEVIEHIKKLSYHGWFNNTQEIKECANMLNKLVDNLETRMQWWEEATVETLVDLYKYRLNKAKEGGDE